MYATIGGGGVLGFIVFAGIATVVEHAGNGPMRLGLALEEVSASLQSKINELEHSIQEMRRAVDNRL
jgi:hypothetical protein